MYIFILCYLYLKDMLITIKQRMEYPKSVQYFIFIFNIFILYLTKWGTI